MGSQGKTEFLSNLPNVGLSISAGDYKGVDNIGKFGHNADVDSAAAEDVWSVGGVYSYLPTATILYASSGSSGDTNEMKVFALDGNYVDHEVSVTLAGTAAVQIGSAGSTWLRPYRAFNNGATENGGDVYIATTTAQTTGIPAAGEIMAKIDQVDQQTAMAIYTIPAGKTGYITTYYASINKTGGAAVAASVTLKTREVDKCFRVRRIDGMAKDGTSHYKHDFTMPIKIPEKTDIKMNADVSADNTDVSAGFDIILVDN